MHGLRGVAALVLILAAAWTAKAETIALKDGRTFRGKVIVKGNTVTVLVGARLYQFRKDQIAVFGGSKPKTAGKTGSAKGKNAGKAKTSAESAPSSAKSEAARPAQPKKGAPKPEAH